MFRPQPVPQPKLLLTVDGRGDMIRVPRRRRPGWLEVRTQEIVQKVLGTSEYMELHDWVSSVCLIGVGIG